MVDKKHKIFLSHAGAEKDFVEQLYRDLQRIHHFGIFFDKEDSLPKGEPFPQRIFDAAKHCKLAIVVISCEYFIRKWPMLELATLVEAQKTRPELKILPIFYKLSVEEFKKEQQSFVTSWKEMGLVSEDEMEKWEEALKVISRTNGLEYNKAIGEVLLRNRIVQTVYKQGNPELMWDDSHVQGRSRMLEMIEEMTATSRNVTEVPPMHTLSMGLYGMGGSGKTTMSKLFRNQMMSQYLGNVFHIEFGSVDLLPMRKELLRSMCQLDSRMLESIDEGQALTLLKTHIPNQRICLIIDNVSDNLSSFEEARTLLNLRFKEGSLILVTSRSPLVLEKLNIERRLTKMVPSLITEEAKALFSHHAGCDTSSLTEEQMMAMENFVERCNFKLKGLVSQEYHPLALKVLGSRVGPNAEKWSNIGIDFQYYENEDTHPIFSILRSSFNALNLKYQRIFLDIALTSSNRNVCLRMVGLEWHMRCLYGETKKEFISQLVEIFQAKSLIEFYDVESCTIYVHDLYREFARMEVEKKGLRHSPRCCFSRGSKGDHAIQEGRARIHNHPVSHITKDILACKVCSKAELLSIQDCANLVSVDVPGMENLWQFCVMGGFLQLTSVKLEGAVNLVDLFWLDFVGEYPDLTGLESLEKLCLQNDKAPPPATLHGCLDFSRSSNLESLYLTYLPRTLLNLHQAVMLKVLRLQNCQHVERFEGIEALVQLTILQLEECSSLMEFPSLANFPSLEKLWLQGAGKLKAIQGFANLSALQLLSMAGGKELEELPGIEACTRMSLLDLRGTSIRDCSWISAMKDLKSFNLSGTKIRFVPCCSSLCKLSAIWLNGCQALESIGTSSMTSSFPKSLEILSADECWSLNSVPQFHREAALYYLDISGTCVEDVSGVTCCKQLQKLYLGGTRITSLPDLSSFTRLEVLYVQGCELLTRMDNIKSLPALEMLWVNGCTSLVALPDLRSSTRLTKLFLADSPLVDRNAVELPSGSTVDIDMVVGAHHKQSDNDVDAQECVLETSAVVDFEAPEPAHNPWRSATFLNLVTWAVSWCGGLCVNKANAG